MGVSIQYEPLYGAKTSTEATSALLTIDGCRILLDCGWTTHFDPTLLSPLSKLISQNAIDVVLLSHADISHLGALPYCVGKLSLQACVLSTLPISRMGQLFMYDAYQSVIAQRDFTTFNLNDIDDAFEMTGVNTNEHAKTRYHLLKYQQHFPLRSVCENASDIVVTPYPAGHMLGGTIWNIKKGTESIVYVTKFNHRRERHLNPCALSSFQRPSHLLIAAKQIHLPITTFRISNFLQRILPAIQSNSNVLIPVDTAGRIIELAVQLHAAWANAAASSASNSDNQPSINLSSVPLVILHEVASHTFNFARCMIEWMSDDVVKQFDISRENLFDFKHIHLCQTKQALDALPSPKVVLASSSTLQHGFARDLFVQWCENDHAAVILIDRPIANTLSAELHAHALQTDAKNTTKAQPFELSLKLQKKEALSGRELEEWREAERLRVLQEQEKEEQARKALEESRSVETHNPSYSLQDADGDTEMRSADHGVGDADGSANALGNGDRVKSDLRDAMADAESVASMSDLDEETANVLLKYCDQVNTFNWSRNPPSYLKEYAPPEAPQWDEYGQVMDTTCFMIGEDPGEGAPLKKPVEQPESGDVTENVSDSLEVIPTKYVEEVVTLRVSCNIFFIDCSGLSDGDSVKRLIKEVNPRCVVVVNGTEEETKDMEAYLLDSLFSNQALGRTGKGQDTPSNSSGFVVCPSSGESVDITSNTAVHELELRDELVSTLQWSRVGSNAVAHVDARVRSMDGKDIYALDTLSSVTQDDGSEMTDSRCWNEDGTANSNSQSLTDDSSKHLTNGHATVFIGTIMLNQLKDALSRRGIKAEFAGGALCVENLNTGAIVLIKKVGQQSITLEGALSEEYLMVRDVLYNELIIPL